MRIPSGPMNDTPPKIARRTNKDGISVSFEIIYGLKILSIVPTNTNDQIRSPNACSSIPVKNKNNIAGIATIDVRDSAKILIDNE